MKLWRYGRPIEYLSQRYRLEGILGSGGMAEVYLAWDEQERREVAVKVLRSDDLDQETLNRFMKEAGQIVGWQHPHILRVYEQMQIELIDAAQGSALFYMVMEYASGGDLHKRLTPGKPFPLSASFALFRQLCDAVHYAHEHGVIHRDLKPLNVLFRRPALGPEEVVLSDFGLAVQMDASHHTFARAGTLAYMAPEQLQGHALPASDIFALGVILYQLCTGRLPFRRTIQDFARANDLPLPTRPSLLNPELPSGLDEPVLGALHELPTERYRSAREFWDTIHLTLLSNARTFPFLADETWSQAGATWPFEDQGRPAGAKKRGESVAYPASRLDSAVAKPIEEGPESPPGSLREKQKASPERSFGLSLPAYSIPRQPNQLRQFANEQAPAQPFPPAEQARDLPSPDEARPAFQPGLLSRLEEEPPRFSRDLAAPDLDDGARASSLRGVEETISERDATLEAGPSTTRRESDSQSTWEGRAADADLANRSFTQPRLTSGASSRHSTRSPGQSRRSGPSSRAPGGGETRRRSVLRPAGSGLSGSTRRPTPDTPDERRAARARRFEQRPPGSTPSRFGNENSAPGVRQSGTQESSRAEATWHLGPYAADHPYADASRARQTSTDTSQAEQSSTDAYPARQSATEARRVDQPYLEKIQAEQSSAADYLEQLSPKAHHIGQPSPPARRAGPRSTRQLPVGGPLSASQKLEASGAPLRRRVILPLLQVRRPGAARLRKWPLAPVAVALALLLLVGAIFLAAGAQGSLLHLFGAPTMNVTLTPQARSEQSSYNFNAVPGASTDSARRQVAARLLNSASPTRTTTAPATGQVAARRATGQLTFINNTANTITVQTATITDNNGVQVSFNGPVTVPANPPTVTVAGFAVNPGANGNIPTLDIDKACCATGGDIFVKNTAFTGGQDAVPNDLIQQSDIDGAVNGLVGTLETGAKADLQRQVQRNERVVDGSLACTPTHTADGQAGAMLRQVHVSVSVQCTQEVYDDAALRQVAGSLLGTRVASDPNLGAVYRLSGPLTVSVLSTSIVSRAGAVALSVQARGVWAYAFTPARLHQLATLIAGKSQADARAFLLQQAGIVAVQFRPAGNLPGNVDEIEMRVSVPAA